MSLTRLYVADRLAQGARLQLGEDQALYLGRVLRLQGGDVIHVFNGEDGEWSATIDRLGKSRATLLVNEHVPNAAESRLRIHLVQGISRGERMDFVVQKATELGVARISPVLTAHGVVKLDERRRSKRRDHWQRVAESACQQSGRTHPPQIDAPMPLRQWFGSRRDRGGTELILRPGAGKSFAGIRVPGLELRMLVGPEGGFSDGEYEDADVAGFTPVALGPRILRTETAALAALAVAQSLWGDLG